MATHRNPTARLVGLIALVFGLTGCLSEEAFNRKMDELTAAIEATSCCQNNSGAQFIGEWTLAQVCNASSPGDAGHPFHGSTGKVALTRRPNQLSYQLSIVDGFLPSTANAQAMKALWEDLRFVPCAPGAGCDAANRTVLPSGSGGSCPTVFPGADHLEAFGPVDPDNMAEQHHVRIIMAIKNNAPVISIRISHDAGASHEGWIHR